MNWPNYRCSAPNRGRWLESPLRTRQTRSRCSGLEHAVTAAGISQDNRWLVTGNRDNTVHRLNVRLSNCPNRRAKNHAN